MNNTSNEQYYRYRKIAIRIRELVEEGRLSSDSQMSVLKIAKLPGKDANVVVESPLMQFNFSSGTYWKKSATKSYNK